MNNQKNNLSLHTKLPGWLEKSSLIFLTLFALFIVVQSAKSAEFIIDTTKKPVVATTTIPVFTRILISGMTGQDVSALQAILSIENQTTITVTGTFGDVTKSALIVFQNKYPIDILIPAGLTSGDGKVGTTTIIKLNELAVKYNIKLSDFAPVSTSVAAHVVNVFVRDLKLGDTGDDVILLKNILNSDYSTALLYLNNTAPAGTLNLYDEATQIAVKKFQEKYASEILVPSGLTVGTGSVGALTRKKLNSILAGLVADAAKKDAVTKNLPVTAPITKLIQQNTGVAPVELTDTGYPHYHWVVSDWSYCPDTWTKCADQGGLCTFTGTRLVKYGVDTRWLYKANVDGSTKSGGQFLDVIMGVTTGSGILCDKSYFGGDPALNVLKACYYYDGVQTRTVTAEQSGTLPRFLSKESQLGAEPVSSLSCVYTGDTTNSAVANACDQAPAANGMWGDFTGITKFINTSLRTSAVSDCKAVLSGKSKNINPVQWVGDLACNTVGKWFGATCN